MLAFIIVSSLLPRLIMRFHDKEFFTIMDAFEEWRHLLEGVQHETIMYSNHKNL
jgi:hypothetical protein